MPAAAGLGQRRPDPTGREAEKSKKNAENNHPPGVGGDISQRIERIRNGVRDGIAGREPTLEKEAGAENVPPQI